MAAGEYDPFATSSQLLRGIWLSRFVGYRRQAGLQCRAYAHIIGDGSDPTTTDGKYADSSQAATALVVAAVPGLIETARG